MTTLDLSGGEPLELRAKIKWQVIAAWVVAAVLGTNGYRTIVAQAADNRDGQAINELRGEVKTLRSDIVDLKVAIGKLATALEYVNGPLDDGRTTPILGRRPRQFDH